MLKKLLIPAAFAIILTACGSTVQTTEITTAADETTAADSITEITVTEATNNNTTETVIEERRISIPDNFSLVNYIENYDDAEPIQYTVVTSLYTYEYKKPQCRASRSERGKWVEIY